MALASLDSNQLNVLLGQYSTELSKLFADALYQTNFATLAEVEKVRTELQNAIDTAVGVTNFSEFHTKVEKLFELIDLDKNTPGFELLTQLNDKTKEAFDLATGNSQSVIAQQTAIETIQSSLAKLELQLQGFGKQSETDISAKLALIDSAIDTKLDKEFFFQLLEAAQNGLAETLENVKVILNLSSSPKPVEVVPDTPVTVDSVPVVTDVKDVPVVDNAAPVVTDIKDPVIPPVVTDGSIL